MKRYLPFRPPAYADIEENYLANLVYVLAWAWIIGVTGVIAVMMVVMPVFWLRGLETLVPVNIFGFTCLLLNRQKHLRTARIILPVGLWIIATLLALTSGGISAPAIFTYLPIIITCGFLLGGLSGILMTALCILTELGFVLLEINGALPPRQVVHTPITLWLAYSIAGLLIAVMQYMVTTHIRSSIQTIVKETDERKLAETRLRESEFNNRMVVENKILGVAWASPDGRVLNASNTFCRMLGYSLDELKGVYFGDFTHPDDVTRELQLLEHLFNKEIDSYTIEKRYKHKSGNYFWVELNLTAYHNAATNEIDFFIGLAQDIQQRKLAEEALRESEERYRALVDNAVEALVVLDVERRTFVSVSESAVQLFKMSREELLTKGPMDLSPKYQPDGSLSSTSNITKNKVNEAFAGGKPVFEWTHCDSEGNPIQAEVRLVRLPSANRILIRGCIIDISERKAAEAEIKHLNESLEKKVLERTHELEILNHDLYCFNAMLSHDLRGAVRRIKSFSELLLKGYNSGQEIATKDVIETLEIIKRDAAKMDGIVMGLLEMSRLGSKPLQLKPVNLNQAVNNVVDDLKKQWKDKKAEVSIHSLPAINSDPLLLQQIFTNLLSNAFKYSSKKAVIKVHVNYEDKGDHYLFSVSDNGVGFDMADHHKLFNEFTRLHHESEFEGIGIGLNNVKRFVEKLGGRIWAESNLKDGSTFYFTLPLQEVAAEV